MMQTLNETALLGTEKKALDIQLLPESVKVLVQEAHHEDPELEFLVTNAYFSFYQLAGKTPLKYTGTWDDSIIEEQKAIASEELLQLLNKFELVDYQIRETLLNAWMNILIDRQLIVSPELVTTLIQQGKNLSNKTKEKIIKVIGNKGMWILQYDPSLNYSIPSSGDLVWHEGNTQERKQLFFSLRKVNPAESIELLRSTWDAEPIVSKKAFLEIIQQTSTLSDLPFIEELYQTEFKYQPKEKKTEKECRHILASIQLKYPPTELYQRTAKNLQLYFTKAKKGILGLVTGKENISFQLPEKEDHFWTAQVMEQQYGFEIKNYDIAVFSSIQQFWLSYFLKYIPMTFWSIPFDSDYKRTLQYWLNDDHYQTKVSGKDVSIYQATLISHVTNHHDNEAASALIDLLDTRTALPLLSLMEPEHFESYIIKNKYYNDVELLLNGPFNNDLSWSLSFSEKIIYNAYDLSIQTNVSAVLGKVIAQYAHPDSIDILYKYNDKARDANGYHNWNTNVFQIVFPALEIRNKIHAYKNKSQ